MDVSIDHVELQAYILGHVDHAAPKPSGHTVPPILLHDHTLYQFQAQVGVDVPRDLDIEYGA